MKVCSKWSTTEKPTILVSSICSSQFCLSKFNNIFVYRSSEEKVLNLAFHTICLNLMRNKYEECKYKEFYDMIFVLKFETRSSFSIKNCLIHSRINFFILIPLHQQWKNLFDFVQLISQNILGSMLSTLQQYWIRPFLVLFDQLLARDQLLVGLPYTCLFFLKLL